MLKLWPHAETVPKFGDDITDMSGFSNFTSETPTFNNCYTVHTPRQGLVLCYIIYFKLDGVQNYLFYRSIYTIKKLKTCRMYGVTSTNVNK